MCSLFIALYHCYIDFYNSEFSSRNLLNLKQCNGNCFEDSIALKKRLPGTYPYRFLTYFRLSLKAIMKKSAGRPIEYVNSTSQKSGYCVLFKDFSSDLRKRSP